MKSEVFKDILAKLYDVQENNYNVWIEYEGVDERIYCRVDTVRVQNETFETDNELLPKGDINLIKNIEIEELAQQKAERLAASFGKYEINDFQKGDFVKFYWKWGENRGIHEGTVFVVNSFATENTIEVMCDGVLYKNLDIYYVIQRLNRKVL